MGSVADLVGLVRQRDLHPCVALCAVLACYTTCDAKRLKSHDTARRWWTT